MAAKSENIPYTRRATSDGIKGSIVGWFVYDSPNKIKFLKVI